MAKKLLTQYILGGNEEQAIGASGGTDFQIAQGFKIPIASGVSRVEIFVRKLVPAPTDPITVKLETDNSAKPSGTLIDANATTTIANALIDTTLTFRPAVFAIEPRLVAATQYWLVCSVPAQGENSRFGWQADNSSPTYADGTMARSTDAGSSWAAVATHDCLFKVFGKDLGGIHGYFNV